MGGRRGVGGLMPAVSRNQRIAMIIAEKHPQELYSKNKGLLSMSKSKLHEFTSTSEKGLPKRKGLMNE